MILSKPSYQNKGHYFAFILVNKYLQSYNNYNYILWDEISAIMSELVVIKINIPNEKKEKKQNETSQDFVLFYVFCITYFK